MTADHINNTQYTHDDGDGDDDEDNDEDNFDGDDVRTIVIVEKGDQYGDGIESDAVWVK